MTNSIIEPGPTIEEWTLRCGIARVMMKDVSTASPDINAAVAAMVDMPDDALLNLFAGNEEPKAGR